MSERIFYLESPERTGTHNIISDLSKEEAVFERYFKLTTLEFQALSHHLSNKHLTNKSMPCAMSELDLFEAHCIIKVDINLRSIRSYVEKVEFVLLEFLTRYVMDAQQINYKDATLQIYSTHEHLPTVYHGNICKLLSKNTFSEEKDGVCFKFLLESSLKDTWCHSVVIINNETLSHKNETTINLMHAAGKDVQRYCFDVKKPVTLPFISSGGRLRSHFIIHVEGAEQIPEAIVEADKKGCLSLTFSLHRVNSLLIIDILAKILANAQHTLQLKYIQIHGNKSSQRTIKRFFK